MDFEDWDRLPNGDLIAHPLTGYASASFATHGILRVSYYPDAAAASAQRPSAVQLGMSASQARDLASALTRMADHLDKFPLGTKQ